MINCWRKKPRPKNIIPTPSDSLRDLGVKEILNEIILFLICLPKRKEVHKQNHGPVKEKVRHSTSFYSGFPLYLHQKRWFQGGWVSCQNWNFKGFFRHQLLLHRCQAAQRKKSPICHPHLGNGLLQRFLLTIQTVDLSKSPWVCFHWVSIGGTLDATTTPPGNIPRRQNRAKITGLKKSKESWCFIDVGVFLPFFLQKKKQGVLQ